MPPRNKAKPATQAKVGRPKGSNSRTPTIEKDLLDWVSSGQSVARWCQRAGVDRVTVWRWCQDSEEFMQRFARAREAGAMAMAYDCLDIADDVVGDPARDRLRVDTRMKLAAKFAPALLGERVAVTGAEDAPPVVPTDAEAAAAIARIFAAAEARQKESGGSDG
jgi:hypothetical protein